MLSLNSKVLRLSTTKIDTNDLNLHKDLFRRSREGSPKVDTDPPEGEGSGRPSQLLRKGFIDFFNPFIVVSFQEEHPSTHLAATGKRVTRGTRSSHGSR